MGVNAVIRRAYQEELADLQAKAQSATAAQMSSLSDANKYMEEAAKADNHTDAAETKKNQTQKAENTQENADTTIDASENADVKTETAETIKNPASQAHYPSCKKEQRDDLRRIGDYQSHV